jgi:hypothetical protein
MPGNRGEAVGGLVEVDCTGCGLLATVDTYQLVCCSLMCCFM